MAVFNHRDLEAYSSVNIALTSKIMVALMIIGFALSLVGFLPIGGWFFVGAFVCALVILFVAIKAALLQ